MAVTRIDQSSGYELVFFWNPRIGKRQAFLRYPRGHPLFPRFIRAIKEAWIALSATGQSVVPQRHWSKNVLIESQFVFKLEEIYWEGLKSDTDFLRLEMKIEDMLTEKAYEKFAEFNIEPDVSGIEYFSMPVSDYLCVSRLKERGKIEKCKCYIGHLPRCS